jgi:acetyl-CoA carboxylase carboxyl transferase subunit beta
VAWFRKIRAPLARVGEKRRHIPEGLWIKCGGCKEIVYQKEVERRANVCPKCNYHFSISAKERIEQLIDGDTFQEKDAGITSLDPLNFRDSIKYPERIKNAIKKTGLKEAVICGQGDLEGVPIELCAFEFGFQGGSMGSVVGEKLTRAIERALEFNRPVVIVSSSGGARMQEGVFSLMQMAKTSSALSWLSKAGIPYISVLTNPTTGGVTASVAMLGDVILAEPGALIGFAGPRVIEQTIRESLPEGFQRAEFLLEHGMLDMVVERRNMKSAISRVIQMLT